MRHNNKEFFVLSESTNLIYGYHEGESPEAAVNVPRADLHEDSKAKIKPFNPNAGFAVSNTMLRWVPVALERDPQWSDLVGKTTSHERLPESADEDLVTWALDFLYENPEFISYLRLALKLWGRVPLQWAGEVYRWPLDAFSLPLQEVKAAQVDRARIAHEQKHEVAKA
jgi:hypothetical protein